MALTKKQRKIIEDLGWDIDVEKYSNGKEYCLHQYSPLGEDFSFNVDYDDPINGIRNYYNDFDEEEHAEMWIEFKGTRGVPNSLKDLLKDARDIKDMIYELVEKLENC